jgi:hypothetical protein
MTLNNLNIIPINETNNLNSVTNELLLKYDQKFNQQYNKIVSVNSSIMNKEEIINMINDQIMQNDIYIISLKYFIIYTIFVCISFILYGLKYINLITFIFIVFILLIIYFIYIYFNVKNKISMKVMEKEFKGIVVDMATLGEAKKEILKEYECPAKCSPLNEFKYKLNEMSGYKQPKLNIDPQVNVWKYGNIPVDGYTSNNIPPQDFYSKPIPKYRVTKEEEKYNRPKQTFGSPSSKDVGTYYKCKWNGNKNEKEFNGSKNKFSLIPCSYRDNFTEEGRYICSKDPNTISNNDFNKYCDNVTNTMYNS